jgi:hypothetical protein
MVMEMKRCMNNCKADNPRAIFGHDGETMAIVKYINSEMYMYSI